MFVVVGVFDGLHLRARLPAGPARGGGGAAAGPGRSSSRSTTTRTRSWSGNAPPLLCDPGERLDRIAAAGVDTTVVVHFDQRLRETTYDTFVAMIAARAPVAGFLMTPGRGVRLPARAGRPRRSPRWAGRAGSRSSWCRRSTSTGGHVRSTEVREDIAAGDLDGAARLLGRSHAVVGDAVPAGEGSAVRFALPVALPPDGDVPGAARATPRAPRPGPRRRSRGRRRSIAGGELTLGGRVARAARSRVAFRRRTGEADERRGRQARPSPSAPPGGAFARPGRLPVRACLISSAGQRTGRDTSHSSCRRIECRSRGRRSKR